MIESSAQARPQQKNEPTTCTGFTNDPQVKSTLPAPRREPPRLRGSVLLTAAAAAAAMLLLLRKCMQFDPDK